MNNHQSALAPFRSRLAAFPQLAACICMILQPVTLRSTWLDTNADGTADTWHNVLTGSSRDLVSLDSESTDIDGDNATNEEERNYGSDPFVFDTDVLS